MFLCLYVFDYLLMHVEVKFVQIHANVLDFYQR